MNPSKLQEILNGAVDGRRVFGTAVSLQRGDGSGSFEAGSGNLTPSTPFFIASTTKLFTTAIVLRLRQEGKLSLDDKLPRYFDEGELHGLHVFKGTEYSSSITVRHLLSHTSGLPDYFQQKSEGKQLMQELVGGADRSWRLQDVLRASKLMRPQFAPGRKGKACYSDTNFQLLGGIIERVTGLTFAEGVDAIIVRPLGLRQTYVYADPEDERPMTLYYKRSPLHVPHAMTSFGPDGGVVSTASELMKFLREFFSGKFFPVACLDELTRDWNRIFYPLQYGIGISRFSLPRFLTFFRPSPEFIGHSGLSGAFAWYVPAKDLYIAGTVNQISSPGISFRLVLRLVSAYADAG